MISPDAEHLYQDLSPETELEGFQLLDAGRRLLAESPKADTTPGKVNSAATLFEYVYPDMPWKPITCTVAANYNTRKDRTVVALSSTASIDGADKTVLRLQFYAGAPFGFVFEKNSEVQFDMHPAQQPIARDPQLEADLQTEIDRIEQADDSDDYLTTIKRSLLYAARDVHLIADPIQEVWGVWDEASDRYELLQYYSALAMDDEDIDPATIQSMQLWLDRAGVALDIV